MDSVVLSEKNISFPLDRNRCRKHRNTPPLRCAKQKKLRSAAQKVGALLDRHSPGPRFSYGEANSALLDRHSPGPRNNQTTCVLRGRYMRKEL